MQDWNYFYTNDLEVTVELGCEKIFVEESLIKYWSDNKYALLSYIGHVHKGVKGFVMDAKTKLPVVNALVHVDGIDHNVTTFNFGDYWRILAPGTYKIHVMHPNYVMNEKATAEIIVSNGAAVVLNFQLDPIDNGEGISGLLIQPKIIMDKIVDLLSTNTTMLLIAGVTLFSFASLLVLCGCYHKFRRHRRAADFDLGMDSAGFHRYKIVNVSDDDAEAAAKGSGGRGGKKTGNGSSSSVIGNLSRYSKLKESDNRKLLDEASDDDEEEDDKIFVR